MQYQDLIAEALGNYRNPDYAGDWPTEAGSPILSKIEGSVRGVAFSVGVAQDDADEGEPLFTVSAVSEDGERIHISIAMTVGEESPGGESEVVPIGPLTAGQSARALSFGLKQALRDHFIQVAVLNKLRASGLRSMSVAEGVDLSKRVCNDHTHFAFSKPGAFDGLEVVADIGKVVVLFQGVDVKDQFPEIDSLEDAEIYQLLKLVETWSRAYIDAHVELNRAS